MYTALTPQSSMETLSLNQLQLTNLHKGKIQVRVAKKWKATPNNPEDDSSYNVVLIDHEHERMHGLITASLAKNAGKQLDVGQLYEISNFQVIVSTQRFKCFQSTLQIVLTTATEVQGLLLCNETEIPRYVFDFTELYQFVPEVQDKYVLHDIVAIVDNVEPLKRVIHTTGGDEEIVEFVVTDLINKFKVLFSNDLGTEVVNALQAPLQHPTIIIISSCRIYRNQTNGEIEISNMSPTTYLLNSNHEEVANLRDKYWDFLPYL